MIRKKIGLTIHEISTKNTRKKIYKNITQKCKKIQKYTKKKKIQIYTNEYKSCKKNTEKDKN